MADIAKRETRAEKERNRNEARVGLASNILGITAGSAALATASRNKAFRTGNVADAGPVTRRIAQRYRRPYGRIGPKGVGRLVRAGAAGAVALQAANLGGDLIANRVLTREAQQKVKKDMDPKKSRSGSLGVIDDQMWDSISREKRRQLTRGAAITGGTAGAALGTLLAVGGRRLKGAKRIAAIGAAGGAAGAGIGAVSGSQRGRQLAESPKMRRTVEALTVGRKVKVNEDKWGTSGSSQQKVKKDMRAHSDQSVSTPVMGHGETGYGSNLELVGKADRMKCPKCDCECTSKGKCPECGMDCRKIEKAAAPKMGRAKCPNCEIPCDAEGKCPMCGKDCRAVAKAMRRFDSEADRQRRLGLYTGAGLATAAVAGDAARRRFTTVEPRDAKGNYRAGKKSVRGIALKPGVNPRKAAALAALALGGAAVGAESYRRGVSRRNQPWS